MKKIVLTIVISILFISIAFSPCINANNINFSVKDEFVKFDIEICGIDGANNFYINLTQKQAEEVEELFISLENQLNESKTYTESASILNESILKLDNYGILGDFKVKQIQELLGCDYQNSDIPILFEELFERYKGSSGEIYNENCLILGRTTLTRIHGVSGFLKLLIEKLEESGLLEIFLNFMAFINWLDSSHQFLSILFRIVTFPFWIVFIPSWILFAFAFTISFCSPFSFFDSRTHGDMQFGYCHARMHPAPDANVYNPSEGWIFTIGDNGFKKYKGEFYGQLYKIIEPSPIGDYIYYIGASNFSGIKIKGLLGGYSCFIGKAEHVSLGPDVI